RRPGHGDLVGRLSRDARRDPGRRQGEGRRGRDPSPPRPGTHGERLDHGYVPDAARGEVVLGLEAKMADKIQKSSKSFPPLRERVEKALATNAAYRALPANKRRQIAHDTVRVLQFFLGDAGAASAAPAGNAFTGLLDAVDFPAF